MKVVTPYNNFARGKIDHDMMARFDLPIYTSGSDVMQNFTTNFKGNAIYRLGLEDMVGSFQDCSFVEFKFSNNQNYILVFYLNTIRFLSYDVNGDFGWVLDGSSNILEVTTTYTLQQAKDLQFTQNNDIMVITHEDVPVKKLTRVSANNFTFADYTFSGGFTFGASQYPACCLYYKGRLYFARTKAKPTTVWGSETGVYDNFVLAGSPTDVSPLQITVADISQKIEWLFGGDNSLIAGSADGIVPINGGEVKKAITTESVEASLSSADGCNAVMPFKKDGLVFYVGRNSRNMYYFSYDLLTESFMANDANFISYDITKSGITKIRTKKDRDDLIYAVRGDGSFLTLNFKKEENIIGWHEHITNGIVKDVAIITDNDGNPQVFLLVNRGGQYYIERQATQTQFSERSKFFTGVESADNEAYIRKVSEELSDCIYLDNANSVSNLKDNLITYNAGLNKITATTNVFSSGDVGKHISYRTITGYESGRFEITAYIDPQNVTVTVLSTPTQTTCQKWYLSFTTITGLTQYIGKTISVVTDGGYLSDFYISSSTLTLNSQTLKATFGYKYRGIIKSFCLGFQMQGENTQVTMKNITKASLRFVSTSGGNFGTSPYKLERVQELSQNDLNYLPPIPIDGTKDISYVDDNKQDKYFYVVQNEPLPMTLTAVLVDGRYSVTR